MKHVQKRPEPLSLLKWKTQANENWRPSYGILQSPEKAILHSALLIEQFFVCCYCGRSVEANNSHIEHFRPPGGFPLLQLESSNLHTSCIHETPKNANSHCGHTKNSWFEDDSAISPLEDGCEARFRYSLTGHVEASAPDDRPAAIMIDVLKLNNPYLVNRREAALSGVLDPDFIDTATNEELTILIEGHSQPENGRLEAFGHVSSSVCRSLSLR